MDPSLGHQELLYLFSQFGDVKGVEQDAGRPNCRFVEFYDLRHAGGCCGAAGFASAAGASMGARRCGAAAWLGCKRRWGSYSSRGRGAWQNRSRMPGRAPPLLSALGAHCIAHGIAMLFPSPLPTLCLPCRLPHPSCCCSCGGAGGQLRARHGWAAGGDGGSGGAAGRRAAGRSSCRRRRGGGRLGQPGRAAGLLPALRLHGRWVAASCSHCWGLGAAAACNALAFAAPLHCCCP